MAERMFLLLFLPFSPSCTGRNDFSYCAIKRSWHYFVRNIPLCQIQKHLPYSHNIDIKYDMKDMLNIFKRILIIGLWLIVPMFTNVLSRGHMVIYNCGSFLFLCITAIWIFLLKRFTYKTDLDFHSYLCTCLLRRLVRIFCGTWNMCSAILDARELK